jgi:flagellar basal-body rod modification protein FlgD
MATDSVSSASSGSGIRMLETTRTVSNELGKDSFLQILTAQMANQDPLSPTSDTEFIAQMAQFSALEQMQNMNSAMQSQMTYSYLNKDIMAKYAVDGDGNLYRQDVYGQVVAIVKHGGKDYLQVVNYNDGNTYLVPPDQVTATAGDSMEQLLAKLTDLMERLVSNTTPKTDEETGTGETGETGDGAEETGEVEGV